MDVPLVRLAAQRDHHGRVVAGGCLVVQIGLAERLGLYVVLVGAGVATTDLALVELGLHLDDLSILAAF